MSQRKSFENISLDQSVGTSLMSNVFLFNSDRLTSHEWQK
jgi:hypothetical protein